MGITIADLLLRATLKLRLADDARFLEAPSHALQHRRLEWAHSSDLDDPTEFLGPATLLLTDGSQFSPDSGSYDYASYVDRLMDAGVLGLGFATQFLHAGTPRGLIDACAERHLPLLEVPDRVPFIAIIREVAESLSAERTEALEQTAEAQRAISIAALRPDAVPAVLRELEVRLHCRAELFDAVGQRLHADRPAAGPVSAEESREIALLLRRGRRASLRLASDPRVTLHTLGASGSLRGVLLIDQSTTSGGAPLVVSVIGLATLALEQRHAVGDARLALAQAVMELLFAGDEDSAQRVASPMWGRLPTGDSLRVIVGDFRDDAALEAFARRVATATDGSAIAAVLGGKVVVLAEEALAEGLANEVSSLCTSTGMSDRTSRGEIARAREQADAARMVAERRGDALIDYALVERHGVLGLLHGKPAAVVAASALAPLLSHDDEHGASLVATLRAWLEANCSWQLASNRLGIHRHTLRSRVSLAGELLHVDLDTLEGRLEAWAALRFSRSAGSRD